MEEDYKLAMEIWESGSTAGYRHINARFVKYLPDGSIDYFYWYTPDKGIDFHRLEISCQMDDHNDHPYAMRIAYDGTDIELRKAKAMVRSLQFIDKGLERLEQKYGYVQGFSEYMFRIADILKVQHYIIKRRDCQPEHEVQPKHARYLVDRMVMDNLKSLRGEV